MKPITLSAAALFCSLLCQAQPPAVPAPAGMIPSPVMPPTPGMITVTPSTNEPVNYVISVQWKDPKNGTAFVQLTTTEGTFNLDTVQPNSVKISGVGEVPTTLKFNGTLKVLSPTKGRLSLFLGRTVPYVTSTFKASGGVTSSSYSQIQAGLETTFIVTFGKSVVVEGDENTQISVLVKIDEN